MASETYYNNHPSAAAVPGPTPLKPMLLQPQQYSNNMYGEGDVEKVKRLNVEDEVLKKRIRQLKFISRVVAFALSILVFVPITLTFTRFLSTRDTFRVVEMPNGQSVRRTAWANGTKAWPTYMYFGIAAASLMLNISILLSYLKNVSAANKTATIATTFTFGVWVANLVVWIITATIYRREKDLNGKSNDLWGWTCSAAAQKIQSTFNKEVDFKQHCNFQTLSWVAGIVQGVAALLSVVIYILAIRRSKAKKAAKRESTRLSLMGNY